MDHLWIESMALRPYWGHSRHFGPAPDHAWVRIHPDSYVQGDEAALSAAPHNYTRVETGAGPGILAYGRDPNFPGWPDTLQLDYCNPELQAARVDELLAIAAKCDGVRCDMAMLLLPEIFQRTWGMTPEPFWPKATAAVHAKYPGFTFMAEVYWDLEWTLQQQGFAYCYDKRQYDRLKASAARPIRDHLPAGLMASILFSWLSEQSYMNVGARGLSPHDLVRNVVDEDLLRCAGQRGSDEGAMSLSGQFIHLIEELRDCGKLLL
jgi:hypothetical protein